MAGFRPSAVCFSDVSLPDILDRYTEIYEGVLVLPGVREEHIPSSDGCRLYLVQRFPEESPIARVLLVHGLGEHSGRYGHLFDRLLAAGIAVAAFDLRGHGRSSGRRGHTPSYEALMGDITAVLSTVSGEQSSVPLILYGHSMGGNLVINYILRRQRGVSGAVVSAPWLRLAKPPRRFKDILARLASATVPWLLQNSGLRSGDLSRDRRVSVDYDRDPLVHSMISARLYTEVVDAGEFALSNAERVTMPILLMHGSEDGITSAEATREFAARCSKADISIFDGLFHEIHNEPESESVYSTAIDWINLLVESTDGQDQRLRHYFGEDDGQHR